MLNRSLLSIIIITMLFTGKTALPPSVHGAETENPFISAPYPKEINFITEKKTETPEGTIANEEAIIPIPEPPPLVELTPGATDPVNLDPSNRESKQPSLTAPVLPIDRINPHPVGPEPALSFLLLGHHHSKTEIIMVVSLNPGQAATLLAVPPDLLGKKDRNRLDPIAKNPRNTDVQKEQLIKHLEEITGREIQFVIGLDLNGVIEMIDVMGGVEFNPVSRAATARPVEGRLAMALLTGKLTSIQDKQRLLRAILFQSSAQELTKVGWTLLKIGYNSLNTDLTIADLLELRKVTHTITPYQTTYRELP